MKTGRPLSAAKVNGSGVLNQRETASSGAAALVSFMMPRQ
jgi:hypothetical protein